MVRGSLQPKEEELSALQERIAERAEQLLQLLDRRRGGGDGGREGGKDGRSEKGREGERVGVRERGLE